MNYHPNIEDDYHSYIPRSKPLPAGPARAIGIGRDPGNGRVLFVTFDRPPTDTDIRRVHDILRDPS